MDILIKDSKIQRIEFNNVFIKVIKNFRYEEPSLKEYPMYKNIVKVLDRLNMGVENSYKCIERLMIYFNSTIGKTLSQYNAGIYRYCAIDNIDNESVPVELKDYVGWKGIHSCYSLYNEDMVHEMLGEKSYAQMSSPIRRIIDIINMIEMHIHKKICIVSENTIQFKDVWKEKVDIINSKRKAIKILESETKLINYYLSNEVVKDTIYTGYIVAVLSNVKYNVYIPELECSCLLKVIKEIPLYTKITCKLYLLQDEINIVQKIRIHMMD